MTKVRAAQALLAIGGSQGIIIPSIGSKDGGVKVITLEGSASMYDPIEKLSQWLRISGQSLEVNLIPSGTAWGKESYEEGSIDFILASLDERKASNTNPHSAKDENTETVEGRQQIYFAQDPLIFVYKKDPKCKEKIEYKPYNLFSTYEKLENSDTDGEKLKGNRKELIELFEKGSGKFSECHFSTYVREGGAERSNLNKTFLETPKDGIIGGLIDENDIKNGDGKKLGKNISDIWTKEQGKYEKNSDNKYYLKKTNGNSKQINGIKLVENNWIAVEHWKRSAPLGSIAFFPLSFIKSNYVLFRDSDLGFIFTLDPETITDEKNNKDPKKPKNGQNDKPQKRFIFNKKFYLQYKNNGSAKQISKDTQHQEWVKRFLVGNQLLKYTSGFVLMPEYCSSEFLKKKGKADSECSNQEKSNIDVDKLFKSNDN